MFHWDNKIQVANTWKISDINWWEKKFSSYLFGIFTILLAVLLFGVLCFVKLLQYLWFLTPQMHNPWDKRGWRRCQDMLLACWFLTRPSHWLLKSITQIDDVLLLDFSCLLALKLNLLNMFFQSYLKTAEASDRGQAMQGRQCAGSRQSLGTSTGTRQVGAQTGNPKPRKMLSFAFKQLVGWRREKWASVPSPSFSKNRNLVTKFLCQAKVLQRYQELGQPCPSTGASMGKAQTWF